MNSFNIVTTIITNAQLIESSGKVPGKVKNPWDFKYYQYRINTSNIS